MLIRNRKPLIPILKIDVTAFASVMVVLVFTLMFLDVTRTRPHHGFGPTLPKVADPVAMPGALREDAVTVTIRRDGRIYLGLDESTTDQLPAELERQFRGGSEQKTYIRADARAKYGSVKGVLDAVRAVGIEKIAFFAEKRQPAPGSL
jgi:biopolymer transport protein ExbD